LLRHYYVAVLKRFKRRRLVTNKMLSYRRETVLQGAL